MRATILGWLALLAAMLGLAVPAAAHLTPNSEVRLAIGETRVLAEVIVPRGEYAYATGNPVDGSARSIAKARAYLESRVAVRGADGRAWRVIWSDPQFVEIAGPPDLCATAAFVPPPGASTARFAIEWRVLIEDLPGHYALFLRERPGGGDEVLGAVRGADPVLEVRRAEGFWPVLASAMELGAHHILEGYDHLMFLLALLLPAPLVAAGGRWGGPRPWRDTLLRLAAIVTAFTIGHSLTLVAATLGGLSLPAAPVEIAIAISVLVSAVHAIRPLVPGREPLVAGGFGLVHGLAFATLVQEAGADTASSAAGLVGFNLGIELVQLALAGAVAPCLMLLARHRGYTLIRIGAGGLCALAALVWVLDRSVGLAGVTGAMEAVIANAAWALPILPALAALSWLAGRRSVGTAGG